VCRRQGLEQRRRCGWKGGLSPVRGLVWARGAVTADACPKSIITAEMLRWIDEYYVWKLSGRTDLRRYPARMAEAFLVLEQELRAEQNNGRE
jgi:hypothetical protein